MCNGRISSTLRGLYLKPFLEIFCTPKEKTFVFLNPFDFEDTNGFKKNEAPNVPLTKEKSKSRLNGKKLDANISQVLFAFMDEE
ncbi:hypothetical protein D0Y65_040172 [Glycine soja]|uniref:Uncharacterized protein n=1 Tax=Glycine soja TaxID=3848 RepID=A0A445GQB6_GLYSO|nr:hypothetical protein D0Y65_040172 [Glycine soja]